MTWAGCPSFLRGTRWVDSGPSETIVQDLSWEENNWDGRIEPPLLHGGERREKRPASFLHIKPLCFSPSLPASAPSPLPTPPPSPSTCPPPPPPPSARAPAHSEQDRCLLTVSPPALVVRYVCCSRPVPSSLPPAAFSSVSPSARRFGDPVVVNCSVQQTGFTVLGWEVSLVRKSVAQETRQQQQTW